MATSIRELQQRAKNTSVAKMGGGNVQQFFDGNRKAIEAALPRHMSADRMLKVAMHAIRTTPSLMECNTASLMGAIIQCSQLGLEPNTVLGHAYLVPFNNRQRGQKEVQVIPGYRGLIDLARRSGQIESIYAHEVCENDHFRIRLGTEGSIEHEPAMDGRGEVIGAYAVAKFRDVVSGGHQFEFMPVSEINKIRDGSQGYQSAIRYKKDHPWISHYGQMARKTVIRRLAKTLPLSIEFATATAIDEQAEAGKPQGFESVLEGTYTVTPDDAPPAEEATEEATPEAPAEQQSESQAAESEPASGDAPSADYYVTALQKAASVEELDEMMAEASDVLSGADKQRATKAYKARKGELMGAEEQQGDFL